MTYIDVEKLTFSYSKTNPLFNNLSLKFSLGEKIALIGKNGAGKTSLIKLLLGMLKPDQGKIVIDGVNINKLSIADIASKIGFVFQNPNLMLFTNSVEDELQLSLQRFHLAEEEKEQRIVSILDFFSMTKYRETNPRLLSRGEKQKLALATVLIQEPEAIILDEPFSGIDSTQRAEIAKYIDVLNQQGKLIILISHNLDLVLENCNRIISLDDGKIIFNSTYQEFFKNLENLEKIGLEKTTYLTLLDKLRSNGLPSTIMRKSDFLTYFCRKSK